MLFLRDNNTIYCTFHNPTEILLVSNQRYSTRNPVSVFLNTTFLGNFLLKLDKASLYCLRSISKNWKMAKNYSQLMLLTGFIYRLISHNYSGLPWQQWSAERKLIKKLEAHPVLVFADRQVEKAGECYWCSINKS